MATAPLALSDKDRDLFKKAERAFQKKLYKQALKNCELILKKNEKHGETVALKGAILGRTAESEEQKQEAIDLCKRGVQFDLSCKNSWLHLARLYKQTMRYEDSIKSFKMALRLAKQQLEKNELRRELTHLLAQTRNWQELADTRRQLQLDNPELTLHWIGYSVSLFLAKNYILALSVWREFCKKPPPAFQEKELMEMKLFEARILEDSGDLKGALAFLKTLEGKTNALGREEACGRLELLLGLHTEAEARYLNLLKDRNTENYDYHRGLQCAVLQNGTSFRAGGLSLPMNAQCQGEIVDKLIGAYDGLSASFPKSTAIQRIPLDFCREADFCSRADTFLRSNLRRSVPSLFTIVKPLYTTRKNFAPQLFESIVNKRLEELVDDNEASKTEKGFALYFLAQHQDRMEPGCEKALETIQRAVELDKANPDFLRFKARVLKHAGNFQGAFEVADQARQLELNDRYLNNKAAKYALRADKPDVALALTHLFTRGEDVHSLPDPAILHDIQCLWFELETAASFARTGDVIYALKNYHCVENNIIQIRDDEFDFHEYCLRRFVLNSYVNLIRMEDRVRATNAYKKMVKGAVDCWIKVFDHDAGIAALQQWEKAEKAAKKAAEDETDESQFAGMTPSEKKRAMKKIKQEKQEKERVELAKKLEDQKKLVGGASVPSTVSKQEGGDEEEEEVGGDDTAAPAEEKQTDLAGAMGGNRPPRRRADLPPDLDPKGFKRFASLHKEPLKVASQLLETAIHNNPDEGDFHILNFGLCMRKREFAQAWKSLEKASSCLGGWTSPKVFERLLPFARFAATGSILAASPYTKNYRNNLAFVLDESTKKSLDEVLATLPKPPVELAVQFLSSSDSTAQLVVSTAHALLHAQVEKEAAAKALSGVIRPYEQCVQAQFFLSHFDKVAAEDHKKRAKAAWPRAKAFM